MPLSHFQLEFYEAYSAAPEKMLGMHLLLPMRIRGPVDRLALRRAFQALIERHAILRATFPTRNGQPVQVIDAAQEIAFIETDAHTWNQRELTQAMYLAAQRLFDLERGHLFRVHLFTQAADDVVVLLVIHHIVVDAHSLWILLEEFSELYRAQRHGGAPQLPPLTNTFADYAQWQNSLLASAQGVRLAAYWERALTGEVPILKLPTDFPRPLVRTTNGATHFFRITSKLTEQLRALAQAEGVTLYMVLLTAYQLLLCQRSGQTEFLLGTLAANRVHTKFSRVVGPIADVLPVRVALPYAQDTQEQSASSFKALLHSASTQIFRTLLHQNYPWLFMTQLLEKQPLPYNTSVIPATFNLVPSSKVFPDLVELFAPGSTRQIPFGELTLEPCRLLPLWLTAWVPCCVEMFEGSNSLLGFVTYITDLYRADTMTQFTKDFEDLLTAIVTNPHQAVTTLRQPIAPLLPIVNGATQ
ncbi:MAG: condensation domain-containing protein [Caldilineaceae bacterium]